MSLKHERIRERVRELVADYLVRELPPSAGLVSVTRVELSKDGSTARVYYSVLPEEKAPELERFLNERKRELQRLVSSLRVRVVPKLEFVREEHPHGAL